MVFYFHVTLASASQFSVVLSVHAVSYTEKRKLICALELIIHTLDLTILPVSRKFEESEEEVSTVMSTMGARQPESSPQLWMY